MSNNYFSPNNPNKICDICGFKMKANQLRKQWDGKLACLVNDCWSPKHPFDTPLKPLIDNLTIKDARPEPTDVFLVEPGLSRWGGAWFTPTKETLKPAIWGSMPNLKWGAM